jgi:NADH-ubiquinone oxidoreductase chain 2
MRTLTSRHKSNINANISVILNANINTDINSNTNPSFVNIIDYDSIQFITRETVLVFLFSALITFNTLYFEEIGKGIGIYNGLYQITPLTQSFDNFLLIIAGLLVIISSVNLLVEEKKDLSSNENIENQKLNNHPNIFNKRITFLNKENNVKLEYSLILIFSIIGGSLLMSSIDIISIYLGIELQSFALYILATIERNSESSSQGGLKYFLLGGLSSCFILLGIALIYNLTGLTNIENINLFYSICYNNEMDITGRIITP